MSHNLECYIIISQTFDLFSSTVLKVIGENLAGTVKTLFHHQISTLMAKLIRKSIAQNKGKISDATAKFLAGSRITKDKLETEETDNDKVVSYLEHWKPPEKSAKKSKKLFSSEEDDTMAAAKSLCGIGVKNFTENDDKGEKKGNDAGHKVASENEKKGEGKEAPVKVSSENKDTLGHVAKIKSIYETPPAVKAEVYEHSKFHSNRNLNISVDKSSTHFRLNDLMDNSDSSKSEKCSLPLTLSVSISVSVSGEKYQIEVKTLGTITGECWNILLTCERFMPIVAHNLINTGIFQDESAKLSDVAIDLDGKVFFQSIVRQINNTIKGFLLKQSVAQKNKPIKKRKSYTSALRRGSSTRSNNSDENFQQRRTSFSASVKQSPNGRRPSKRDRMSLDQQGMSPMRPAQRARLSGLNSFQEAAQIVQQQEELNSRRRSDSIPRFSGVSHLDMDAMFRLQPNHHGMSEYESTLERMRAEYQNEISMNMNGAMMSAHRENALTNLRNSLPGNTNNFGNSMAAAAEAVRLAEAENKLNTLNSNANIDATISELRRRSSAGGHFNSSMGQNAQEAARLAEIEAALHNYGGYNSQAQDAFRLAEVENAMRRQSSLSRSSITGAEDAIRLAEMEQALRRGSRSGMNSMQAAAEAVQRAEMEQSLGRRSASESMNAAAEAVRIAEMEAERRRRSSLTEAMRLVEMDAMRRSSAGTSMHAAAEAVRLAEMDVFGNQRRFSSNADVMHNESMDNLASLMRRSTGPQGSMAAAAEAVRMSELGGWNGGGQGNSMSIMSEAARLAEMENELTRQLMGSNQGGRNDYRNGNQMNPGTFGNSGRRVSFVTQARMQNEMGGFQR